MTRSGLSQVFDDNDLDPMWPDDMLAAVQIYMGTSDMAYLGATHDASTYDPSSSTFEPIPPGDYMVWIEKSDMKPTKNGNGEMLVIELSVIDGPHKGRKLFDRLNLKNQNTTAVEIAQRTLSSICHAVGVMSVSDSEQLHLKPMTAKVIVKPARTDTNGNQWDASNEVKGYAPIKGAAHQPASAGATASAEPDSKTPAWRRR